MVNNLEDLKQYRWFHYQTAHPEKITSEAFDKWLTLEEKEAIRYGDCILVVGYHVAQQVEKQRKTCSSEIGGVGPRKQELTVLKSWPERTTVQHVKGHRVLPAEMGYSSCQQD